MTSEERAESGEARRLSCGLIAPLTTPFTDERIDLDALQENVEQLNSTPVTGYVALGSTGEAPLLSEEESIEVIDCVVAAADRKQVYVGVRGESLFEAQRFMERVSRWPVRGFLCWPPSYYRDMIDEEVLVRYYRTLAERAPAPLLIYNVPKFTGIDIPSGVLHEVATHPKVSGWKDSSANLSRFAIVCQRLSATNFASYIGSGPLFLSALRKGAAGGILALANIAPELCAAVASAHASGDGRAAERHQERLSRLDREIFQAYGIAGLKCGLDAMGFAGGAVRAPYKELTRRERESVHVAVGELLRQETEIAAA